MHRCRKYRSTLSGLAAFAVLLITLHAAAAAAEAQSSFAPDLSLTAAVERALDADPRTKRAEVGVRIADLKVVEANSQRKPSVQFTQSVTRSNNPVFVFGSLLEQGRFAAANFALDRLNQPDGLTNFRTSVEARYAVYDKGQTNIAVSRAQLARKQADLGVESARQKLRFEVIRDYYALVLANEMLKVSDEAVRSAAENARKTKDYVAVGLVMESDALAADVELAGSEQRKIEALANRRSLEAALNIELGSPTSAANELTSDLQERFFPLPDEQQLIIAALEQRPDVRQADIAIDSSRELSRAVRSERKPRVDAYASYGYSSPYIANGSADYTVGASLTFTLFDAGRKPREQIAVESETAAELDRKTLADQVRLDVIRAVQSHITARSKIQVSVKAIRQAEEALRIVHDRYKFGLTTFTEVLRAEAALVKTKHDLLSARYDLLVSYASILLATGRLTDVRAFE